MFTVYVYGYDVKNKGYEVVTLINNYEMAKLNAYGYEVKYKSYEVVPLNYEMATNRLKRMSMAMKSRTKALNSP